MQWLKRLFTLRCASNGVIVGGETWNPGPFGFRLRGQDAKHSTEQMTVEKLACDFDSRGELCNAKAILATCREESARLRAYGHTIKD